MGLYGGRGGRSAARRRFPEGLPGRMVQAVKTALEGQTHQDRYIMLHYHHAAYTVRNHSPGFPFFNKSRLRNFVPQAALVYHGKNALISSLICRYI